MKRYLPWFKHGFWNTLEHGVTRVSDALASLVLLWTLSPESFAKLSLAQAWVAPCMLLFISPETVVYRDYSVWKEAGPRILCKRLQVFRLFSWSKIVAAVLLASGVAVFLPLQEAAYHERFFALIWAFFLFLAPQLSGADREFLRLDLKMNELSAITLYQKVSLLCGTALVATFYPGHFDLLAAVAVFSALTTSWLTKARTERILMAMGVFEFELNDRKNLSARAILSDAIRSYSIWLHVGGVMLSTVLMMDLFFLGWFSSRVDVSARDLGLYAAVLKIANFSNALPNAFANLFFVRISRKSTEESESDQMPYVVKLSGLVFLGSLLQAGILWLFSPYLFSFLSRGRWTPLEQSSMQVWVMWILAGGVLFNSTLLVAPWLLVRNRARQLTLRIYLPWLIFATVSYAGAAYLPYRYFEASSLLSVAQANVAVSFGLIVIIFISLPLSRRRGVQP